MNAKTVRVVLRAMAMVAALAPALALAVMTNPPQIAGQQARFTAQTIAGGVPREEMVTRLIVKPRYRVGDQLKNALNRHDASGLAKMALFPMSVLRPMSGDANVIHLDKPVTLSEARVIAARLMRDSSVELAVPDRLKRPLAVTPTDPSFSSLWNLFAPSPSDLGGANLPNAWGVTTGSNTVTVAVIDTGYRQHADLSTVLPGYDFISDPLTANDGDGRDADAQDPGDWITSAENTGPGPFQGCGVSDSSWHGTHVAGIIAAQMNNGIGIVGVAPNIQILPVRVLGKCGGYDSDIIDGMRWAAGLTAGLPANPNPAQVLNMSLGNTASSAPCSSAYQSAVNDITAAGKMIVAAAGNDGSGKYLSEPANCTGVIAVTAHVKTGDNANYANIGAGTFISAPGGGCGGTNPSCDPGVYSLWNTGLTLPASDSYTYYQGTSMATPHVTGVIALMLSADSTLTPAQIKSYLQSSARPHPAGTTCTKSAYLNKCGAGLLDAYQALNALTASPPAVTLGTIPAVAAPGTQVTLSGSAVAGSGRSITTYAWSQQTGPASVTITNPGSRNSAYFIAPVTGGTYSFKLTATDNGGQTGTATAVVIVNSPPVLDAVSNQTVSAGQPLNFTVTATDPDGDTPIIFNSVSLPAGATLSASGDFSWPNATPIGNYTLVYYASDPYANSANGTVNITVNAATAAPSGSGGGGGGGGGGSLDTETLVVLTLLAAGLRLRRPHINAQK